MSSPLATETFEAHGCRVECRRYEGPVARELYLLAKPPADAPTAASQAESVDRALAAVLEALGGDAASAVTETVFLADLDADLEAVRAGRRAAFGGFPHAATLEIEQPPLEGGARLQVTLHASIARDAPPRVDVLDLAAPDGDDATVRPSALCIHAGDETRLHAASVLGAGKDAYAQTLAMFERADDLLAQAGMTFHDVARTWIHLREMDRDYDAFNRARRTFFEARGVDPPPASTGIGGAPCGRSHDLVLGLHALTARGSVERTVMTTPTLNEAPVYGSDFVRGMKVVEANKTALHVSGTASIDERGETVHTGDLDAQVDRMLVNIAALLEGQGAGFGDIASGITYVKRPADAPRVRARLEDAGFAGFPNAIVAAPVCRPELLCEAEVLAVLPKTAASS